MTTTLLNPAVLSGVFGWRSVERATDRYGAFTLNNNQRFRAYVPPVVDRPALDALDGRRVKIVAKVLATRPSSHIGDFINGLRPSTPNVGDIITLGVGILNIEPLNDTGDKIAVALVPNDGRDEFWFNPCLFYRLHDQTVEITVAETDEDFSPPPPQN